MARVLMIPTARPTFDLDQARLLEQEARQLLLDLGAEVTAPKNLVMTPEDIQEVKHLFDDDYDLVVNVCASFSDASPALELYSGKDFPVLLWAFREPGVPGERLLLNSMCGANLFAHALVREGQTVRLLHGNPHEPEVAAVLARALNGELPEAPALEEKVAERADAGEVREALESLRGRTLGLVDEAPVGFTPSQFDPALLEELFGISTRQITVDDLFERIDEVPEKDASEEKEAALAAQRSLAELDAVAVNKHAETTAALRAWREQDTLSALAVRCWPEFPTNRGVCPCSSMSRIADEGTPTACERDVYGAVTMMLMEALGAGTTYLVDTVDVTENGRSVRFWHCGAAATKLAADPENATQAVHCNRKIGVAGNFPLRTGPVVFARLTESLPGSTDSGLRLLLGAGESVPAENRFQGNTAEVELEGLDGEIFASALVSGGFPHHTVLAWNDVRPQLRAAADALGIPVVEWQ